MFFAVSFANPYGQVTIHQDLYKFIYSFSQPHVVSYPFSPELKNGITEAQIS